METAEPQKAAPQKRRRGFQFSLRDLLALVALAALACAIAFPMVRKWQRIRAIQEKAKEELKAMVKPVHDRSATISSAARRPESHAPCTVPRGRRDVASPAKNRRSSTGAAKASRSSWLAPTGRFT